MAKLVPDRLLAEVADEDIGEHRETDDEDQITRHIEAQGEDGFDLAKDHRHQNAGHHRNPDPEDEEDY